MPTETPMRDYRWLGPLALFSLSFAGALGAMAVLSRDPDATGALATTGEQRTDGSAPDERAPLQRAGFSACVDAVMVDLALKRARDIRYGASTSEACGLSSGRSR